MLTMSISVNALKCPTLNSDVDHKALRNLTTVFDTGLKSNVTHTTSIDNGWITQVCGTVSNSISKNKPKEAKWSAVIICKWNLGTICQLATPPPSKMVAGAHHIVRLGRGWVTSNICNLLIHEYKNIIDKCLRDNQSTVNSRLNDSLSTRAIKQRLDILIDKLVLIDRLCVNWDEKFLVKKESMISGE